MTAHDDGPRYDSPPPPRAYRPTDLVATLGWVFGIVVLAVVFAWVIAGCEVPPDTHRGPPPKPGWMGSVESMGFKDVREADYQPFVCAKDDSMLASHGWTGVNANGQSVKGMACCGLILKGCTVRF